MKAWAPWLRILALPMTPWQLASAARSAHPVAAIAACLLGCGLCFGISYTGIMTVAKEPYWTIENWFGGLQESAGEGLGMMLACTGFPVLFLLIALVGPELSGEPRRPRGRVLTTSARCLLLTPLTVVVPVTLWALAVALSEMPNRWAFGGTVTWHQSALIGCAGSMWAALIVVLTSIGFSVFTAVRHRERPAYECQHCGYALSGLPESCPCPECGTESRA